ncbi:thiol-disulfide oxidoreductase DCC family protein [Rheinheimera sp. 4Y26]|uniref:thiol-disulfide oxidoreductase DCC family protein n=1 Tax=Rheinheimera sp. 4Y26 TaxID=2977811 RepID=UPI0021B14303|nr:DUF393 domain-containing protein [Rheinheimera sp. 4Y26]MCT6698759.1 DUF393 domain-containing protein [Rheinheimera sp. 4Y26]
MSHSGLTVLYDGSCPLCSREIAYYQKLQAREPLLFIDVSNSLQALPDGINRCDALKRFHLVGRNGQVWQGARAFLRLWRALPGWRWLGYLGAVPPLPWLMEAAYRLILPLRRKLARFFRKAGKV